VRLEEVRSVLWARVDAWVIREVMALLSAEGERVVAHCSRSAV
jgi:hypothetical protein